MIYLSAISETLQSDMYQRFSATGPRTGASLKRIVTLAFCVMETRMLRNV
jgi:hypothetical protein